MLTKLINFVLRPRWVAVSSADAPNEINLGLKIWGVVFGLYKGEVLILSNSTMVMCRKPGKREFGESLHPAADAK